MSVVVWSKENCFYCHMAKGLLEREGIEFEERNIETGSEWSRADMLEAAPDATTVPQIFMDGDHIGGFTELQQYLKED